MLAGADYALLPQRAVALRARSLAERRRRGKVERVFIGFDDRFGAEPLIATLLALSVLPTPLHT
ncbi:MAG TPA: hypothetical protein PK954_20280, partial [Anaerolineales bacterium]|nr:hypothetical protein [Anaerolineales bacterium]